MHERVIAPDPMPPSLGAALDAVRFLGLTGRDFAALDDCLPALDAATGALADRFYAFMLSHPEMRQVFQDPSPERLAALTRRQAAHAVGLLRFRLDEAWREQSQRIGRAHQQLGISPAWLAGAYALYWQHWDEVLAPSVPAARQGAIRNTLFKLLVGDLMAQLAGYAEAVRETDHLRIAIFERFVGMVEKLAFRPDVDRQEFLRRICEGLVEADEEAVGFAGFLLVQGDRSVLAPGYFAGTLAPCAGPVHRDDRDPFWQALATGQSFVRAVDAPDLPGWLAAMAGTVQEIAAVPIGDGEGFRGIGLLGVRARGYLHRVGPLYFKAFAELAELGLRLYAQNLRDPVTGLPNRAFFAERLAFARARAERQGQPLGVGLLDLDAFKRINDTLGHHAGDRLLGQVARRLRTELRAGDMLARLGGDEFGLLITESERSEHVADVCERLLVALRRPFALGAASVEISGSLGLTLFPRDPADAQTLVRHADLAAYAAKAAGKDQLCLHTPGLAARARRADDARELLVAALTQDRLLLHYQPIVAPQGHVLAIEALARVLAPGGELIGPDRFASALDHGRVARPLGRRVLALAGAQAAAWRRAGLALTVAVNLSASHMLAPQFLEDLAQVLDGQPDLPRGALLLELTESGPLQDLAQAETVFRACATRGVGIAIDDFGTGHTSLSWLRSLSPRMIKIDRSFVDNVRSAASRERAIVAGILAISNQLGVQVIAEGVGTMALARSVTQLGCHGLQGFAIAHPLPAERIAAWVRAYPHDDRARELRALTQRHAGKNDHDRSCTGPATGRTTAAPAA